MNERVERRRTTERGAYGLVERNEMRGEDSATEEDAAVQTQNQNSLEGIRRPIAHAHHIRPQCEYTLRRIIEAAPLH